MPSQGIPFLWSAWFMQLRFSMVRIRHILPPTSIGGWLSGGCSATKQLIHAGTFPFRDGI
jgi:hypothetical protein